MTRIYSGTATVTNGDATVVITSGDPLTAANCPNDAPIAIGGVAYHVASRTDTTTFELTRSYVGSTGTVAVEIDPLTPDALSVVNIAVLVARVQAQLNVLDKNSQGLFYNRVGVTGDTDTAPGNLAFDNADPSLVTAFYIDNLDGNQRSVTGLLDLWTSGTIVLIRSLATTAYVAYRLPSGVSVESGYYSAATQYVDHDGVLADGEAVSIGWFRVGEGLEINASGDLAGRDAYDDEAGGFVYITDTGDLYRKNSATSGDWGPAVPLKGMAGDKGWAPRFAVVSDGARAVMQLAGYVGGTGDAPTANIGQYVSTGGYTGTIGSATDIRGATGATGAAGTNGTNGTDGTDGIDGTDPGVLLIWDDGTTDANPGSGVLRANNALTTSASFLYVNKANRVGADISVFLATLDDSSSSRKGIITLTRPSDKAQATFDVVTLTDATGYVKVGVVNGGGTTFTDNDLISFQFAASGDKGTDGAGAGNFVTEFEPAIDPTGNLVKFSDDTGTAGEDTGIPASDIPRKSNNLSDLGNLRQAFDNLSLKGADIASSATVDLDTATGDYDVITGTTATSAFTLTNGKRRWLLAAAAWPITAGATVDINNGSSSYTCAAKDRILVVQDGSVTRLTVFPASGLPVARVTNAKLAQVATATVKGRTTAGTGDPEDLTATQATALLSAVVGDSGSGGTKGLVPAPSAGDAAAAKFLKADGTWAAVSIAELELTISQLALQVADNTNVALFLGATGNRVADSFDALTYVDVAGATNLDSATAGLLKPTVTSSSYSNVAAATLGSDTGAVSGTVRQIINSAQLLSSGAGTVRVTIKGGASGLNVARVFIGSAAASGDVYDFASAPTQLLFSGVANAVIAAGGTALATGTYNIDGTKNLVIAIELSSGSAQYENTRTGWATWYKAGATTDGSTVDATGYVVNIAAIGVSLVERQAPLVTNNLTVRSASFTAASAPTKMKALIRVKEVDAATAGTDYTLECSRDGGTTWTAMTLTELFTSPSPTAAIRVVEAAETSVSAQPSGTAPQYRFKTPTNKIVELHDVYFYWS